MKVAFVANTSWNIYNFRKGLVQHFIAGGNEVIVLSPKDNYSRLIQEWGVRWFETPLDGTGINPLQDLKYLKSLHSIFKSERPDVALCFTIKSNIYACLAGRFSKVPIVCNVSGLGTTFLVKGLTGKVALTLYRVAFKYASHVFFQNTDDKELFLSKVDLSTKKIGLLPGSGINLEEFQLSTLAPEEPVKFLMISRLIIEKGVREYAEAASTFKNNDRVSFTLVGKFDPEHSRSIDEEELKQWTSNGWIDYLPHSDRIKERIKEHEVIVLPSYREGTPRTLLEGAAIGRPLLTSNVPGCKEVVKDGYNGFLFDPKSSASMVDKIKLYLSMNSEEKIQLSLNSRQLVEEIFSEKRVIDAYLQAIHRINSKT